MKVTLKKKTEKHYSNPLDKLFAIYANIIIKISVNSSNNNTYRDLDYVLCTNWVFEIIIAKSEKPHLLVLIKFEESAP